jgi:hypothetical protein
MDKDRFYETLKYLVYLFEKRKPDHLVPAKTQVKARDSIGELFLYLFSTNYIVFPRSFLSSIIHFSLGLEKVRILHDHFIKLRTVLENLPEDSRFDVQGLMNDLSQSISDFEDFTSKQTQGLAKRQIMDLLPSHFLKEHELDGIVKYHVERFKDPVYMFQPDHPVSLPLRTKESTTDLIGRLGLDELEASEITEAFNRCDTVGEAIVLIGKGLKNEP